jgi:hypothetical protein
VFRISGQSPANWLCFFKSPTGETQDLLSFFLLPFYLRLLAEVKSSASIIGATCVFDTKKYKTVDTVLAVSSCLVWNKKIFDFFYFYSALPSLLVDFLEKTCPF